MSHTRLEVSIDDQQLHLIHDGQVVRTFPVSTSAKGIGSREGSNRTPIGTFHIVEKIGADAPAGTIFISREPRGLWPQDRDGEQDDLILSRILRLAGDDEANANTYQRYIYIHGTNHEDRLGTPASDGCIRMSNSDVMELFERVDEGTPLTILPPTRGGAKLFFFDCDSTLSTIEGIDELARFRGEEVYQAVVTLTDAAMNGELPLDEVFGRRMEIIQPDRAACDAIARQYIDTATPGAMSWVNRLKSAGWTPIILSGGFAPLIEPLAQTLGIEHVEAVPIHFHEDGSYAGFDSDFPTTRNGGKSEIIREWKSALLPQLVVMMGDGISDLETKPDVDLFIGFGGVVEREIVRQHSEVWIDKMDDLIVDNLTSKTPLTA